MTYVFMPLRYDTPDSEVEAFVRRTLNRHKPLFLATTESGQFHQEFGRIDGYDSVHHVGLQGQGESAILVRDGELVRTPPVIKLSDKEIPRRNQYAFATPAVLRSLSLVAVHMPSGVEAEHGLRDNGQASVYREAVGTLRRYVAENHVDIIVGDWNLDVRLQWVREYFALHFPQFVIVAPPEPTHRGGRIIDFALMRRPHEIEAKSSPVSDHKFLVIQEAEVSYYTRSEWGARPARARYGFGGPDVKGLTFHWPATKSPVHGVDNVMRALRGWQDYHMDDKGWSDIAYQEAFDQDGNVYELRGLSHQPGANGNEHLNETLGAFLLILAPGEDPSPEMVEAVHRRVTKHRELHPSSTDIIGHDDARKSAGLPGTACPGPIVERLISEGAFEPGNAPREEDWFSMATKEDLYETTWKQDDTIPAPKHWPEDNAGTSPDKAMGYIWQGVVDARADARAAVAGITALAEALESLAPDVAKKVSDAVREELAKGLEITVSTNDEEQA